jgi:hypothetical protein
MRGWICDIREGQFELMKTAIPEFLPAGGFYFPGFPVDG